MVCMHTDCITVSALYSLAFIVSYNVSLLTVCHTEKWYDCLDLGCPG